MLSYNSLQAKNTAKARLLETLELLDKQGVNNKEFEILNAIATGLIWSSETDVAVRTLGKKIAQELYDNAMQNAEFGSHLTDPDNPSNW